MRSQKTEVRRQKYRARGFTLVEVLTAATLMAIVLPVAMYGVSVSLQASTTARRQAEAATLAEGKLEELAATALVQSTAAGGNDGGDFGTDFPGYKWQSTVSSIDLGMEQIDVKVTWMQRSQERELTVSTWVYLSSAVSTATGGT